MSLKIRRLIKRNGILVVGRPLWIVRTPEQREAWIASYKPRNEKNSINENLKGEDLVKWKYQRYIKDYVRCIKSIDDEVGRLIAYLEKEGLMDNTVIVYTSDQRFLHG